jgi:hypothetical protein
MKITKRKLRQLVEQGIAGPDWGGPDLGSQEWDRGAGPNQGIRETELAEMLEEARKNLAMAEEYIHSGGGYSASVWAHIRDVVMKVEDLIDEV